MAKRKIIWSHKAKIKLTQILEFYIERNKSKTYSVKLYNQFQKNIKLLVKQPHIGVKTNLKDIRSLIIGEFMILYDKGYHTGSEFNISDSLGIKVMVAIPAKPRSSEAPDPAYNVEYFQYNAQDNTFICPQGHTLRTNGTWHKAENGSLFQQFRTGECKRCPVRPRCTRSEKNGKIVQRRQYAENIEENKRRIEQNLGLYKQRQAIVEHPYGTIKRQWGFNHVLTKEGKSRASADIILMMSAYNLR